VALIVQFIHEPTGTLDDIKTGLSNGTIWALIALGYTLVYGIIELINFAHGEVFMIGSFVSVSLWQTFGVDTDTAIPVMVLSIIIFLPVAMLASGSLNVMIERVAYRPLRNAPKLAPLITAIGMSFILQNVGLLWRPTPDSAPDLIGSQKDYFKVFDVAIEHSDVFAVAITVPLLVALLWFVGKTKYGKAMRATAQDPDAARLMGIDVDRTIQLTFLLGGLMAGAAGLIYALYNGTVRFNQGFTAGLIAFTAAVMGGIGNLKGAVVGGLIIGVIQAISDSGDFLGLALGPQWTPAVVFGVLILVMVFRPQGLFGEETREG
jgi:branched-chain amino acid transport system permease protein